MRTMRAIAVGQSFKNVPNDYSGNADVLAKSDTMTQSEGTETTVGPRHDVPGGRRIDIAPVPASRAAFGDTPAFAGRAAAAACA